MSYDGTSEARKELIIMSDKNIDQNKQTVNEGNIWRTIGKIGDGIRYFLLCLLVISTVTGGSSLLLLIIFIVYLAKKSRK